MHCASPTPAISYTLHSIYWAIICLIAMGPYRTEDTDDDSCWSEESDDNIDSPQDRKAPANFEASQVEQPYVNTNIVRACNRPINLDPDYVGDWEDPDAFREFYQNW